MISPQAVVATPQLMFVTAAAVALAWRLTQQREYRVSDAAFGAFIVYAILALFSVDPYRSTFGTLGAWGGGLWPAALLVGLTGLAPRGDRWLWGAGCVLAAHVLAQRLGWTSAGYYAPPNRMASFVGGHLDAGAILAMALAVAPAPVKVLLAGGIWATGSRGAALGAAVALLPGRWKLLPPALALAAALGPMQPLEAPRQIIWKIAARSFAEHPLVGSGPETFMLTFRRLRPGADNTMLQNHAHNVFLEAASTGGLIGLVVLAFFVWPLRADPALQALLTCMQFNPIGFPALALAALRLRGGTRIGARDFGMGVALISSVLLAVIWAAALADPADRQRLLRYEPNVAIEAVTAGVVNAQLGDEMVRIRPMDPHAHYARALIAVKAGDADGAKRAIDRAEQLDPHFGPIKRLRAALHGFLRLRG